MPHVKKVRVDGHVLGLLKELLDIDTDVEAVHTAITRIIELEETLMWLAEIGRLPNLGEEWESDADAWKCGGKPSGDTVMNTGSTPRSQIPVARPAGSSRKPSSAAR